GSPNIESRISATCTVWSTREPPPASSMSVNQSRAEGSLPLLVPVSPITSPSVPPATAVRRAATAGEKWTGKAVISTTPASRQAATIASASATVVAGGDDHGVGSIGPAAPGLLV